MKRQKLLSRWLSGLFLALCAALALLPGTALAGGATTTSYRIASGGDGHTHMYNQAWPGGEGDCPLAGTEYHDPSITYSTSGRFTLNGFHGELEVEFCDRPITIELVGDDNVLTEFNPPQYASPTNPAITFVGNGSVTIESTYEVEYTLIIGGDGTSPNITVSQYGMLTGNHGTIDLRSGELHLKNYMSAGSQYGLGCYGSLNPQIILAPGAVLTAEGGRSAAAVSLTGDKGPRSGVDSNHSVRVTGRDGEPLYWSSQNAVELSSAMLYNGDGTPAEYARFEYTETPWETTEYVNLSLTAPGYDEPIVFQAPRGEAWRVPAEVDGHAVGGCEIGRVNVLWPGCSYACLNDTTGALSWANGVYNRYTFNADASDAVLDGEAAYSVTKEGFFTSLDALPEASRPGYRFGGWFTQPGGQGEPVETGKEYLTTKNFYAYWIPNGVWFIGDGENIFVDLNDDGTPARIPEGPGTVGGVFRGWYTEYGGKGDPVTLDTVFPTGEITRVYAYYDYNRVSFWSVKDMEDGQELRVIHAAIPLTEDGTLPEMPADPVREDYRFEGWYTRRTNERVTAETVFPTGQDNVVEAKWTYAGPELGDLRPAEGIPLDITVASLPDRRAYAYGEPLDTAGLSVRARLSGGGEETVPAGELTVSGYDPKRPGSQTVTVSYQDLRASFTVMVSEPPIDGVVPKPMIAIAPVPGGKEITLTCAAEGADLYYTTGGSLPTASSTPYTGPLSLTGETTILKAAACLDGKLSAVTAAVISVPAVETPTVSGTDGDGWLEAGRPAALQTATPGAVIYYTLDGSDPASPDSSRQVYHDCFLVTSRSNVTLRAVAVKDGFAPSAELSKTLHVSASIGVGSDLAAVALGNVSAVAGDIAAVPVCLLTEDPLASLELEISYPTSAFTNAVSVSPVQGGPQVHYTVERGKVTLSIQGDGVGSGQLCTLLLPSRAGAASDAPRQITIKSAAASSAEGQRETVLLSGQVVLTRPPVPEASAAILFTGPDGSEAAGLAGPGVIEVSVSAASANVSDASVYLITYDKAGRMSGAEAWRADLSDPSFLFLQTVRVPEDAGSVKVVLSSAAMTPLCAAGRLPA